MNISMYMLMSMPVAPPKPGPVGVRDPTRHGVQPSVTDNAAQRVPQAKEAAARAEHRQHLSPSQCGHI